MSAILANDAIPTKVTSKTLHHSVPLLANVPLMLLMLFNDFSLDTARLVESDSNKSTIVQTPITSIPQGSPEITPTGSILELGAESNDCSEDVETPENKECSTSMPTNDNPSVSSTSTCAAAILAPSDMSCIAADSTTPLVIDSTSFPQKKISGSMKPGKSTSPRNLCAIDWVKVNEGGSTAEFAAHWNKIEKTLEAEPYHQASAAAKEAKKKAAQS
ncbi:hypothetical protein GG344DRAFT_82826 [Lentinula edodes]|nr:hypothetical protein GG344DRAFT_82826 [Lentinula edodes]